MKRGDNLIKILVYTDLFKIMTMSCKLYVAFITLTIDWDYYTMVTYFKDTAVIVFPF